MNMFYFIHENLKGGSWARILSNVDHMIFEDHIIFFIQFNRHFLIHTH